MTQAAWAVAPEQAAERLADPAFDPRQVTVVEGTVPELPGGAATSQPRITTYEPQRVVVQVDLERPGLLNLSDTYFPDWRASVDGIEVPLYRANLNFRAVYVPTGRHQIVMWYDTRVFWLGAGVSIVALLGCFVLLFWRTANQANDEQI
jgi:hypothetical protein